MQAGGRRFEPVHLHQSRLARLIWARDWCGRETGVGAGRKRSFCREPRSGTPVGRPWDARGPWDARAKRGSGRELPRRVLWGSSGAMLMDNCKEASCVTEAEASGWGRVPSCWWFRREVSSGEKSLPRRSAGPRLEFTPDLIRGRGIVQPTALLAQCRASRWFLPLGVAKEPK